MPNIFFEVADGFFKSFLANSHGMKSKDQKRREKNRTRGTQPFDPGRDLVTASQSLEQLFGEFKGIENIGYCMNSIQAVS